MFLKRLRMTLDMIRFEHSVFALPFALTGALLAFRESSFAEPHKGWIVAWIVVAMVGARSAAMAFNRLVDAEIDSRNPRTKSRHACENLVCGFRPDKRLRRLVVARKVFFDRSFKLVDTAMGASA